MVAAAYLGTNPFVEFRGTETPQLSDPECRYLPRTSHCLQALVIDFEQYRRFLGVQKRFEGQYLGRW
jgi:hypothetical protein